jgi:RNA polymerase sigma-70 factor (ECF subfamily)
MQPGTPYDDAALIQQLSQCNRSAFETIYKKYFTAVFFMANRYVADVHAAEDIAMESFMKVWDKRKDFEDMEKLYHFLSLATRNSCLNFIRGKKRKLQRELNYSLENTPPEANKERDEIIALVYRHICEEVEKMPKQLKEIFRLAYSEGLSNEEIAHRMQISSSTVSNHKNRLLNLLRERFSRQDFFTTFILLQALSLFAKTPCEQI